MSLRAFIWAVNVDLPTPAHKAVLMVLANYADENGQNAWPSRETIARQSCISPDRVTKMLTDLRKIGAVHAPVFKGQATPERSLNFSFKGDAELSVSQDENMPIIDNSESARATTRHIRRLGTGNKLSIDTREYTDIQRSEELTRHRDTEACFGHSAKAEMTNLSHGNFSFLSGGHGAGAPDDMWMEIPCKDIGKTEQPLQEEKSEKPAKAKKEKFPIVIDPEFLAIWKRWPEVKRPGLSGGKKGSKSAAWEKWVKHYAGKPLEWLSGQRDAYERFLLEHLHRPSCRMEFFLTPANKTMADIAAWQEARKQESHAAETLPDGTTWKQYSEFFHAAGNNMNQIRDAWPMSSYDLPTQICRACFDCRLAGCTDDQIWIAINRYEKIHRYDFDRDGKPIRKALQNVLKAENVREISGWSNDCWMGMRNENWSRSPQGRAALSEMGV